MVCRRAVEEHGYAWGVPWGYITLPQGEQGTVTVFEGTQSRLHARVDISLNAGEAAFEVSPSIENPTATALSYQFWLNAMAAPGGTNHPTGQLHFVLPADRVIVHSRGDASLSAAGQVMAWPIFHGRDMSLLGNWREWLGVFAYPHAQEDFVAVYERGLDEGLVRVFPRQATPGVKVFGLGFAQPIAPELYTDGDSSYVKMHGGVAPTFGDQAELAASDVMSWRESWFPVFGIGDVTWANGRGAVHLDLGKRGISVGVFSVVPVAGRVQVTLNGGVLLDEPAVISPAFPYRRILPVPGEFPASGTLGLMLLTGSGEPILEYSQEYSLNISGAAAQGAGF